MRVFVISAVEADLRGITSLQVIERVNIAQRRDQLLPEINLAFTPQLIRAAQRHDVLAHVGDVLLIFGAGSHLVPVRNSHGDLSQQGIEIVGRGANVSGVGRIGGALCMAVTKEHLDISRQALLQSQRAALLDELQEGRLPEK